MKNVSSNASYFPHSTHSRMYCLTYGGKSYIWNFVIFIENKYHRNIIYLWRETHWESIWPNLNPDHIVVDQSHIYNSILYGLLGGSWCLWQKKKCNFFFFFFFCLPLQLPWISLWYSHSHSSVQLSLHKTHTFPSTHSCYQPLLVSSSLLLLLSIHSTTFLLLPCWTQSTLPPKINWSSI